MTIDPNAFGLLALEVQAEIAENLLRKDLLPSEIDKLRQRCEAVLTEQARSRQAIAGPAKGRGAKHAGPGTFPEAVGAGRVRDQIGALAGISGRSVEKIAKVCQAARDEPEKYGHLAAEMDQSGRVDAPFKQLQIAREREVYASRKVTGGTVDDLSALATTGYRARVVYADPPWTFNVYSGKGKQRSAERYYDTQSLDDIVALGPAVQAIAARDSVLFLWTVAPGLPGAFTVLEGWGFEYKTVGFCWVKTNADGSPATGMGYWSRSNVELCLLATRGNPHRLVKNVHQLLMAPRGEHSVKPEEIRRRIERMVAGPYLELFGRRTVDGWHVWGNEVRPARDGTDDE